MNLRILKRLSNRAPPLLPMPGDYREKIRAASAPLLPVYKIIGVELIANAQISFCTFGMCPECLNRLVFLNKPKVGNLNLQGSYIAFFNGFFAKPAAKFCHTPFPKSFAVTRVGHPKGHLQLSTYWFKKELPKVEPQQRSNGPLFERRWCVCKPCAPYHLNVLLELSNKPTHWEVA